MATVQTTTGTVRVLTRRPQAQTVTKHKHFVVVKSAPKVPQR